MKILQVFNFLSLPQGGGSVDIIYRLSRSLSSRGHKVTICIGNYQLDQEYIDKLNGIEVKVFRSYYNKNGIYLMPSLVNYDIKEFDVIHFHCYRSIQNAVIYLKAKRKHIPYLIDAHGSTVDTGTRKEILKSLFDDFVGYRILDNAKAVIAETDIGVYEYMRLGVDKEKIKVVHPAFDVKEFENLPEYGLFREKYNIDGQMVLFVGRIHQAKGIEVLVEAVSLIKDAILVIVGQDDGYTDKLFNTIYMNKVIDRVIFTGYLEGQDKLSVMVDADVLVQPSKNEAGARPSLEAIMCGTPVIVTKNTGAGLQIEKMKAGLTVEYGDVDRLRSAIEYMLREKLMTKLDTTLGKVYIQDNMSFEKQVVEYENLYKEIV